MYNIKEMKLDLEKQSPLILNTTNYVTMEFMANALLSVGAAPIMSEDSSDIAELVQSANAININSGTISSEFIHRVQTLLDNKKNIPTVFDPVGSGASIIRTEFSKKILPYVSVVRGNASEIASLHHNLMNHKGVESTISIEEAKHAAIEIAQKYNIIIAMTGSVDFITDGHSIVLNPYGTPLMKKITGAGCILSSIIAAFCTVEKNYFTATVLACIFYSLCAELSAINIKGPGSFMAALLDQLYDPNYEYIQQKINEILN